ncbi:hypothetical protein GP486_000869 [Trichoglossum hirsutum]|uniref:Nudix hydrolase domain-containing protein n=1 Tax=Trichoglossum hirsutum TaxID=265104 RepID=A0A9P8LHS4_9PEZI|nr:hypothetical protein GP486_000869 [Trichoglossum hirsutum]
MSLDAERVAPLGISGRLQPVLEHLAANPYPEVPNPPNCQKRASVALIIRVQPSPDHWPPQRLDRVASSTSKGATDTTASRLDEFFSLSWVKHGEPEVLFIRRAARARDRWGSHIALPGGKRDPGDESDQAAAVRETWEEVGLDLSSGNCVFVGNLSERVVTTSWGKVPLMVLCSFVYILTEHDIPPLRLQPSEVESAHWVSFRTLLAPSLRTYEHCDISDRLANRGNPFVRTLLRAVLGQMAYAAVKLAPSESLYSGIPMRLNLNVSSVVGKSTVESVQCSRITSSARSAKKDQPLLLWGLTFGILTDFLHLIAPYGVLDLWAYPTFTAPDIRFIIWVLTHSFRHKKQLELHSQQAIPTNSTLTNQTRADDLGFGVRNTQGLSQPPSPSITGRLLDGYYDLIRKAIAMALIGRIGIGASLTAVLWLWYRQRRKS